MVSRLEPDVVLTTALLRGSDIPARVVFGMVLFFHPDELLAVGHAWVEFHDGSSWRIADSTRPEQAGPEYDVRYLPVLEIKNEGPGYLLDYFPFVNLMPKSVNNPRQLADSG